MRGSYVLLIRMDAGKRIRIGRLGMLDFRPGWYAYVGSAMNSLEGRTGRHLRGEKKRFWHIDYLLEHSILEKIFYRESERREECETAEKLTRDFQGVPGFGCSDCSCRSHLFFSEDMKGLENRLKAMGMKKWEN